LDDPGLFGVEEAIPKLLKHLAQMADLTLGVGKVLQAQMIERFALLHIHHDEIEERTIPVRRVEFPAGGQFHTAAPQDAGAFTHACGPEQRGGVREVATSDAKAGFATEKSVREVPVYKISIPIRDRHRGRSGEVMLRSCFRQGTHSRAILGLSWPAGNGSLPV
jgi:hypothetical protein